MLKNYLKIALRSIRKSPGYSFINIFGLSVGMACCILIFLFTRHEWSYDSFHENSDHIYRLYAQETRPDGSYNYRLLVPPVLPPAMETEFPGIDRAVQLVSGPVTIRHNEEPYREHLFEADSTFFEVFSFPLLAGDSTTVLDSPDSMVLSERLVQKYFGTSGGGYGAVLGQTLEIQTGEGPLDFTISGVMRDMPSNSSLQIDLLISFENYSRLPIGWNEWGGRTLTYFLLDERQDPRDLEAAFRPFTETRFASHIEERRQAGLVGEGSEAFQLRLQPLTDTHLNPDIGSTYDEPTHNPVYTYILAGIAGLVLLIACINFMTLSVARSIRRAREVGVRKVMGGYKAELMKQFWGEAMLYTLFALVLGVLLTDLALPVFNNLTGRSFSLSDLFHIEALAVFGGLVLVTGFVAGSYPAMVLSRFQPAVVLKSNISTGGKKGLLRGLVVAQYVLSIALMVSIGIMLQQLRYLQTMDLGYRDEQIVILESGQNEAKETAELLRGTLLSYDQVRFVSGGKAFTYGTDFQSWTASDGTPRGSYVIGADYDYVELMQLEMVDGRDFSREFPSDPVTGILVNETLAVEFGLEDPVGMRLPNFMGSSYEEAPVILGVVRDFHFQSLHEEIESVILTMHPNYRSSQVLARIGAEGIAGTISLLEQEWKALMPETPFQYSFLDEAIQQQYEAEQRTSQIIGYSAFLSLLISCLGLLGLSALAVSSRAREIGIRKVLGASVASVMNLLSGDFVRLVLLANIIAWPVAYWGMKEWLQNFAYRVEVGWWIFPAAAGVAMLITILVVGSQAIRAATANPVEAIRSE